MLETIISGLILAAVSGITFLAYKHPDVYKTMGLSSITFNLGVLVFAVMNAWNFGIGLTYTKLLSYLAEGKQHAAEAVIEQLKFSTSTLVLTGVLFFVAFLYFTLLLLLHFMLKHDKSNRQDH